MTRQDLSGPVPPGAVETPDLARGGAASRGGGPGTRTPLLIHGVLRLAGTNVLVGLCRWRDRDARVGEGPGRRPGPDPEPHRGGLSLAGTLGPDRHRKGPSEAKADRERPQRELESATDREATGASQGRASARRPRQGRRAGWACRRVLFYIRQPRHREGRAPA